MQKKEQPTWQVALLAAVRETNPGLIEAKIQTAEAAVSNRMVAALRGPGFAEEQALFEALDTIHSLKSAHSLRHGEHDGKASAGLRLTTQPLLSIVSLRMANLSRSQTTSGTSAVAIPRRRMAANREEFYSVVSARPRAAL